MNLSVIKLENKKDMHYISLSYLSNTIRKNFYKIPHDVDFVIGIPRSGMICGGIISEFLNVPLIDIDSFCFGSRPTGGGRLRYYNETHNENNVTKKVLVVDDTVFTGISKKKARQQLESFNGEYSFIFLAVYLEGFADKSVDIYLEDIRWMTNNFKECVLYEWNIFHNNEEVMKNSIFDIDGVFCIDPPDERDEEKYIEYIKNPIPLFIPSTYIGEIVTYRLNKNREITEKWLNSVGIRYGKLIMFNANTWDERNNSGVSSEILKGNYYKQHPTAKLFYESNDYQAMIINKIANKPVFCIESNKMYQ